MKSTHIIATLSLFATAAVASSISCKANTDPDEKFDGCFTLLRCIQGEGVYDYTDNVPMCVSAVWIGLQNHTDPVGALACCSVPAEEVCSRDHHYGAGGDNPPPQEECEAAYAYSCSQIEGWGGETGPDGSESAEVDSANEEGMTGADSSEGGSMCPDGWHRYRCRGFAVGLYEPDAGPADRREFTFGDNDQYECITEIVISAPESMADNEMLFDLCREACEDENFTWDPDPLGNGTWDFDRTECVFEYGGNNGYVPADQSAPDMSISGQANCNFLDQDPLVIDLGAATVEDCESVACTGWQPNASISYSYNMATRVHTVSMARAYLESIYEDIGKLFVCDDTRYEYKASKSRWEISTPTSGDFLYRLGLRGTDFGLRMKRTGYSTWYTLDGTTADAGMENVATALEALVPYYNNLTGEFRRPKSTAPYYDLHTINLTLTP